MAVAPVPAGHHSVTRYLVVDAAAQAIAFCERAFGAQRLLQHEGPDGRIAHAEVQIGDSPAMLADATDGHRSPQALGGTADRIGVRAAPAAV
jgi:PhnB protein